MDIIVHLKVIKNKKPWFYTWVINPGVMKIVHYL